MHVGGQLVLPQRVDELPGGDRAPGVEREAGEQRAQAPTADVDPVALVLDFERPEHAYAHQISSRWSSRSSSRSIRCMMSLEISPEFRRWTISRRCASSTSRTIVW